MNIKFLLLAFALFTFTSLFSQEVVIIKESGFGDIDICIKESGFGDIDIIIKESGSGDVDIRIKQSGMVDYLIYSENKYISKREIIAALINVIKKYAEYEE